MENEDVDDDDLLDLEHEDVPLGQSDDVPLIQSGLVCQGNQLYKIDSQLESLDYENQQSAITKADLVNSEKSESRKELERWVCCFLIGLFVGLTGIVLVISIEMLSLIKVTLLQSLFKSPSPTHTWSPWITWAGINLIFVLSSSLLCVYLSPVAAGSGIPQIKCFLNGIKIPGVIRIRAYLVKVVGIILAVVGGLAVGKEGPMVHAGAVIAGGISQGQSISLGISSSIFETFRNDHEKRDFVAAGAAAGVSAAFGAPVGGVLFALEEAASFWNQALTWRLFFTTVISYMTLDFGKSGMSHNQ